MSTNSRMQKEDQATARPTSESAREQSAPTSFEAVQPSIGGAPQRQMLQVTPLRRRPATTSRAGGAGVARGFGWFSIGLGLAEIAAPRRLAKMIGVKPRPLLFRALGLREIASGLGLLSGRGTGGWMWSRVAGDAMDLTLLGAALASNSSKRGRVLAATGLIVGTTALDAIYAGQLSSGTISESGAIHFVRTNTINRSPDELYRFWRDFQNLPRFMYHLEEVRVIDDRRSHWVAKAPAGTSVEWDAEITEDRPNELIAWRSLEGADVDNTGSVRFAPATAGRGTVVTVEIEYNPPGGALGAGVAKLFGEEPAQQTQEDLRRFKQVMEAGEVPTTEGQSSGRE